MVVLKCVGSGRGILNWFDQHMGVHVFEQFHVTSDRKE